MQTDSATPAGATGPAQPAVWPVRSGALPSPAGGLSARPETSPGLGTALLPGGVLALVPAGAGTSASGLESYGKTECAASFARAVWESRQVDLLAWVTAASRASVLSGYAEAAAAVGIDTATAGPAESVAARFAQWLTGTGRPWLMVLDDLLDAADMDGLWPQGTAGMIVITAPGEVVLPPGQPRVRLLPVGPFSTREALNFLIARLSEDPDQRRGAMDLAVELGGDPAALAQAGAVIATTGLSCHEYQVTFTRRRAEFARQAGEDPPAAAVTWALSAEQAEQMPPGAATRRVLALAALLDGNGIPGALFTTAAAGAYLAEAGTPAVLDPERAWNAVLALERAGLLAVDPASSPPVVRISRFVQAQVRAAMPAGPLSRAALAAASALLELWPGDEPQPWLAAGLRSCVSSLHQAAGDGLWAAGGCHLVLWRAGRSLDEAGLTGPAASHWTQLGVASDKILGSDHPDTLTAGSHAARALLTAGQAGEAAAWSRWVVAGRTRGPGADHPDTIADRVNLGRAMVAAGEAGPAVAVLTEAVADYERVLGVTDPASLSARDELAAACQAAGRPGEAIENYRRALIDRERAQGARHPDTMASRERLASACLADGRLKDAVSHCKRALEDRERIQGADHPDTIAVRRDLASTYQLMGKIGAALQLYEQACADSERVLGAGHRQTLACRADLVRAYFGAGRMTDAAILYRDTLARCEQSLPAGDPLTKTVRESMAGG